MHGKWSAMGAGFRTSSFSIGFWALAVVRFSDCEETRHRVARPLHRSMGRRGRVKADSTHTMILPASEGCPRFTDGRRRVWSPSWPRFAGLVGPPIEDLLGTPFGFAPWPDGQDRQDRPLSTPLSVRSSAPGIVFLTVLHRISSHLLARGLFLQEAR